ncbi:uncharacterized protein N7503_006401 [Penicillium pulvis]|uniref:uncharacterized protein n=1 Tax=Penicillium pulvis TaxID=1562058 RepID=UPI002546FF26|nr:uncharacterized protein N7503_006401 [Penicillium pulvis]KAJ5798896.1 hypothetical protein N7503_006401 [Penicillium pulvis]
MSASGLKFELVVRLSATGSHIVVYTSGAVHAGAPLNVCTPAKPSITRLLIPKSPILTHHSGPVDKYSLGNQKGNATMSVEKIP